MFGNLDGAFDFGDLAELEGDDADDAFEGDEADAQP